ncbi:hypothetical protein SDC9_168657 [bioreactor metagenome]|uniref:Uncharacterized protein n=1 Tax=bioreactor metagenome TaxID=1076179 RepID=A0A645G342_9ZZZZ
MLVGSYYDQLINYFFHNLDQNVIVTKQFRLLRQLKCYTQQHSSTMISLMSQIYAVESPLYVINLGTPLPYTRAIIYLFVVSSYYQTTQHHLKVYN